MKKIIFIFLLTLPFLGCKKKDNNKEDYRNSYIGTFNFMTIKRTIVMCYDSSSDCIDGWKEINKDTNNIISDIEKHNTNRIKIQFGDSIIGVNDKGDTIYQTIYPILSINGVLSLPEYPIGGHNNFTGFFKEHDTVEISIQFGYGIGGYDKYEIIGLRN